MTTDLYNQHYCLVRGLTVKLEGTRHLVVAPRYTWYHIGCFVRNVILFLFVSSSSSQYNTDSVLGIDITVHVSGTTTISDQPGYRI